MNTSHNNIEKHEYSVMNIDGKLCLVKNGQKLNGCGKIATDTGTYYHKNGLIHNTKGPAIILNENNKVESFVINGKLLTREEYLEAGGIFENNGSLYVIYKYKNTLVVSFKDSLGHQHCYQLKPGDYLGKLEIKDLTFCALAELSDI